MTEIVHLEAFKAHRMAEQQEAQRLDGRLSYEQQCQLMVSLIDHLVSAGKDPASQAAAMERCAAMSEVFKAMKIAIETGQHTVLDAIKASVHNQLEKAQK